MTIDRRRLLTPAVLGFLIYAGGLPSLSLHLAEAIMRAWSIDEETLDRLAVRAYPTRIENLIASYEAALRYGDLSTVPGFYLHRSCWYLNLDPKFAGRGFVMPITDDRGLFHHLVAFRSVRDGQPFVVQLTNRKRAAA